MSFYNSNGYRIERSSRRDDEMEDYYEVFELNFDGLERNITGRPDWKTKEEAREAAGQILERLEEFEEEIHEIVSEDNSTTSGDATK